MDCFRLGENSEKKKNRYNCCSHLCVVLQSMTLIGALYGTSSLIIIGVVGDSSMKHFLYFSGFGAPTDWQGSGDCGCQNWQIPWKTIQAAFIFDNGCYGALIDAKLF